MSLLINFLLIYSLFITKTSNELLENVVLSNNTPTETYIGKKVYVYKSVKRETDFNLIRNKHNLFLINKSDVINFGLTNNSNWIYFKVINKLGTKNYILNLEYPIIDKVSFFVIHQNGKIDSTIVFEGFYKTKRLFNSQFYLLPININKNEQVECYINLVSYKPILVPLSISTVEKTVIEINNIDILSGIYFGIMLVMFLYNYFIYVTTKDKSYLYYIIYIAVITLTQLTLLGYSDKYVWSSSEWFSKNGVTLFGALSGIVTIIFTDKFLFIKEKLKFVHILFLVLLLIDIISIAILIFGYNILSYHIVDITAAIGVIIVLITAIILVIKQYKPAKFFLIGWIIFLIAVFLYVVKDYGIIPYNNFTIHSLQVGSALEAILLSFALADKINIYKKEKEVSQAATLTALQENDRIIREQNSTLERKVTERTNELVLTNDNLSKTLTDLKEAQIQLVEAEKMASLGQLTAGIAHEINNPINFVTSNVAPLRRDVDILVDAIMNIETLGMSEASIDEKQQQIEDYKEEIDLDYLKIEIGHLLNGIHEGATRTADIVKGLRVFSRLDEDDLKKADINEGLSSTLTIANNLIGSNIQVIKSLGDIPVIECYPGKLNQVFLNIISNAVFAIQEKFGNQNGGMLNITTVNDEKQLTISIADNGTGMSEATKNKIFEPFFTTKNVGVGTGLGMSIVYNTIKKHNAEIYLNSTEGIGTEFIIKLNLVFEEPILMDQSQSE